MACSARDIALRATSRSKRRRWYRLAVGILVWFCCVRALVRCHWLYTSPARPISTVQSHRTGCPGSALVKTEERAETSDVWHILSDRVSLCSTLISSTTPALPTSRSVMCTPRHLCHSLPAGDQLHNRHHSCIFIPSSWRCRLS